MRSKATVCAIRFGRAVLLAIVHASEQPTSALLRSAAQFSSVASVIPPSGKAGASRAKSRFVHSPGRLLLNAALFSLVLLTLDLSLGSFLLIEQDRFDGRNPRQGVQAF